MTLRAFLRMEFIEEISYPLTFVFTLVRSLMPLLLSFFIGQLVRGAGAEPVGGDYLTFVTIGLGVTAMLQGALVGFGGILQQAFMRGNLETYLVEPVPWTVLPLAMNTWAMFLGVFNGVALMVLGIFLGADLDYSQIPAFLLLVTLGLLATTAIGILSASVLMLTLKSQPILVVYGVGGVTARWFGLLRLAASDLAANLLVSDPAHVRHQRFARSLLMQNPGSFDISFGTAVLVLSIFSGIAFPIGLWLFRRSLEFARRMGLLSGY